jgi:hypothetical protein
MKSETPRTVSDLIRDNDLIQNALTKAVQGAVREHKLLGQPIVIWRDGKVVWVPPEEIELEEESHKKNGKS